MTTSWVPVSGVGIREREMSRHLDGVSCKVSLSPYDIPQAIRAYEDVENNLFVIELKYLTEEPLIEKMHDQFTRVDVGVNSNRVYRIKLDLKKLGKGVLNSFLERRVAAAIDDLPGQKADRVSAHYGLTKRAIRENGDKLFSGFHL